MFWDSVLVRNWGWLWTCKPLFSFFSEYWDCKPEWAIMPIYLLTLKGSFISGISLQWWQIFPLFPHRYHPFPHRFEILPCHSQDSWVCFRIISRVSVQFCFRVSCVWAERCVPSIGSVFTLPAWWAWSHWELPIYFFLCEPRTGSSHCRFSRCLDAEVASNTTLWRVNISIAMSHPGQWRISCLFGLCLVSLNGA